MTTFAQSDLDLVLQAAKNAIVGGGSWVPVYQAILGALTETIQVMDGPEITTPVPGATASVLTWIAGAAGVNGNSGAFASYIRQYTNNQYSYRAGASLDQSLLQTASNNIARNFTTTFLFGANSKVNLQSYFTDAQYASQNPLNPTIPSLSVIGGIDAAGAAATIFTGAASSTGQPNSSPWAGTVLFTQLGDPEFFKDWILQMDPNTTQYGSKVESGTYDLIAAAEDTTGLATLGNGYRLVTSGQLGAALGLLIGNSAKSDAETAADRFFEKAYGNDTGVTDIGSEIFNPFLGTMTSADAFQVGTIAGESINLKEKTEVLDGGPGDDTVSASEFYDAAGIDGSVIDGGGGNNTLSYDSSNAPVTVTLQNQGYWNLRLKIDAGDGYATDYAYEFGTLNLKGNGDKVVWDGGLTPANVSSGTSGAGGTLSIVEKPADANAVNTVDLSALKGNFTFDDGRSPDLNATFSGFSTLKGPGAGKETFNITPASSPSSSDVTSFTEYEGGGANNTFNVNYATSDAAPLLLAADENGGDVFNFANSEKASFTVVWGGTGQDTFNINADASANVNVVSLKMSGVTEENLSDLDLKKLEAYVEKTYSLAGQGTIVLLNPTGSDHLNYNGIGLTTPQSSQLSSEHSVAEYSTMDTTYRKYEGLTVGPQLYTFGPDTKVALISTQWSTQDNTNHSYGLEAKGLYYRPGVNFANEYSTPDDENGITIENVTGSTTQNTGGSGIAGSYNNNATYQTFGTGSLSLVGFTAGQFGVKLSASGPAYAGSYDDHNYQVSSWANATVQQDGNIFGIFGTQPGSLSSAGSYNGIHNGPFSGGSVVPQDLADYAGLNELQFTDYALPDSSSQNSPQVEDALFHPVARFASDASDRAGAEASGVSIASFEAQQTALDAQQGGFAIADDAEAVSQVFDALNADANATSITLTDAATPVLSLTSSQALFDASALGAITNTNYTIAVSDTAENIAANFDGIGADATVAAVTIEDSGSQGLVLTVEQALHGQAAFAKITNTFFTVAVSDTAAQVSANIDALNADASISSITLSDGAALALSAGQALNDTTALDSIVGPTSIDIHDTAANVLSNAAALESDADIVALAVVDTAADVIGNQSALAADGQVSSIIVQDTAGDILANSDALTQDRQVSGYEVVDSAANIVSDATRLSQLTLPVQTIAVDTAANVSAEIDALASDPTLGAVTLTDNGAPTLTLSVAQVLNDGDVLDVIAPQTFGVAIADTAADVASNFDALEQMGAITSVLLTDQGVPDLTLTAEQALDDARIGTAISNPQYTVTIADTAADIASDFDGLADDERVTALTLDDSGVPQLALSASQAADSAVLNMITNQDYAIAVFSDAADVAEAIDSLNANPHVASISLVDGGTPDLDLDLAQAFGDARALAEISTPYGIAISDTAANILSGAAAISGDPRIVSVKAVDTVSDFEANEAALEADPQVTGVTIVDSAADVAQALDTLSAARIVSSVSLEDAGSPHLDLSVEQLVDDGRILGEISNAGYGVTITDSAANVSADLDIIGGDDAVKAIDLTDGPGAVLTLSVAQAEGDGKVLSEITDPNYAIAIADTAANVSNAFDSLDANPQITTITLTDDYPSPLRLTADQALYDSTALAEITNASQIEVVDTAADVSADVDALDADGQVASILLTDAQSPTLTLTAAQVAGDAGVLDRIVNYNTAIDVQDTAADVSQRMDLLAYDYEVASITLTDAGTPTLDLSAAQALYDAAALAKISDQGYEIAVQDGIAAIAYDLPALTADPKIASIGIFDTAANVAAGFDFLAKTSAISTITFSDATPPVLALTAAQTLGDSAAFAKMSDVDYQVDVTDSAINVSTAIDDLGNAAVPIAAISLTDPGTPVLTLTAEQALDDTSVLAMINGPYQIAIDDSAADVLAHQAALAADPSIVAVTVTDTVANILDNSGALSQDAQISSIVAIDSSSNIIANLDRLQATPGLGTITAQDTAAGALANKGALSSVGDGLSVSISDTAADISANIDALAADAQVSSVTLTDDGTPSLTLTAEQAMEDQDLLASITNAEYAVAIVDTAADVVSDIDQLASDPKVSSISLTNSDPAVLTLGAYQAIADASAIASITNVDCTIAIEDTAADFAANIDGLSSQGRITSVDLTDGGTPTLDLTAAQATADAGILEKIQGPYQLAISDSASDVAGSLDALNADPAVASITLSSSYFWLPPTLDLTANQIADDTNALAEITNGYYDLDVTDTAGDIAAQGATLESNPAVGSITVEDTAANIATNADALNSDPKISSIILTDPGEPTLSLSATQASDDSALLYKISGSYVLNVVDTAAEVSADFEALSDNYSVASIALTDSGTPVLTLTAGEALESYVLGKISNPGYRVAIDDTEANIASNLDALNDDAQVTSIVATDSVDPNLTLTAAQVFGDATALAELGGSGYSITVADTIANIAADAVALSLDPHVGTIQATDTAADVLAHASDLAGDPLVTSISVSDTASDVVADLAALSADPTVSSICVNDGNDLVLTVAQTISDAAALGKLTSDKVAVFDSAANVAAGLDALNEDARLVSITLTDPDVPTLDLTWKQVGADADALATIADPYAVRISDAGTGEAFFASDADYEENTSALDADGQIGVMGTGAEIGEDFITLGSDPNVDALLVVGQSPLALTADQSVYDAAFLSKIINSGYTVAVTDTVTAVINDENQLSSDPVVTSITVDDSAPAISAGMDALNADAAISSIAVQGFGTATLVLSAAQALDDSATLAKISGSYQIAVSDTVSDILANAPKLAADNKVTSVAVVDTAANVLANSDALTAAGPITTVTVSDTVENVLGSDAALSQDKVVGAVDVVDTAANVLAASAALSGVTTTSVDVSDTAANVLAEESPLYFDYQVRAVAVVDTAADVSANFDALYDDYRVSTVTLTDAAPVLTLNAYQAAYDGYLASKIAGPFTIAVTDSAQDVAADLDALASVSSLSSIALTDTGAPVLTLTASQVLEDATALGKIETPNLTIAVDATAAQAVADAGSFARDPRIATVTVVDTAENVSRAIDELNSDAGISQIDLTDGGTPTLALSLAQATNDTAALGAINSGYDVQVQDTAAAMLNGSDALAGIANLAGAIVVDDAADVAEALPSLAQDDQIDGIIVEDGAAAVAANATAFNADAQVTAIKVSDTAANVSANFDALDALTASISITLTDPGTPVLSLTLAQAFNDWTALDAIAGYDHQIAIRDTAANVLQADEPWRFSSLNVLDTAADVSANIDALNDLTDLGTITLTDPGTPVLTVTAAQALDDAAAISDIDNPGATLTVADTAADLAANLDPLNSDALVSSTTLTDAGTPTLSLSASQVSSDAKVLGEITNATYTLSISDAGSYAGGPIPISGTHDLVTLNAATLQIEDGASATVAGADDQISLGIGAGVIATAANEQIVALGGGAAVEASSSFVSFQPGSSGTVAGTDDAIDLEASDSVEATGTGDVVDVLSTGNALAVTSGSVSVFSGASAAIGGNDDVVLLGSGSTASVSGTGDIVTIQGTAANLNASSTAISFQNSASALVEGSNDTLVLGNGSVVTPVGTGNQLLYSTGESATIAASSGPSTGSVELGAGISLQDLWFRQSGNDLQMDLMGSNDTLTVDGWFGGGQSASVQSFTTVDGSTLDTQVAQLVSAMATYSANNAGFDPTQISQAPQDAALQSALASAWHH